MGFYMGFLKNSKTEHNPFLFKNRKYKAKTAQIKRFKRLMLELLGRFELREDDFISSSLLLFQHFAYCFCATLVPAYPYSSLFIFSCKGKNKGKTFITYKHSIAFLQQLHLELERVSAYQASPASSKESYNRTTWTLPGFERDAFISGPLVAPLFPP